jgi:hypothetical protein
MKIEVIVDKDNTHFSHMYECDAVKDYSNIRDVVHGKLVLLRENPRPKNMTKEEAELFERSKYDTVAVFAIWTAWVKLPDNAERCERCGRYKIINKNGYCPECEAHFKHEQERAR